MVTELIFRDPDPVLSGSLFRLFHEIGSGSGKVLFVKSRKVFFMTVSYYSDYDDVLPEIGLVSVDEERVVDVLGHHHGFLQRHLASKLVNFAVIILDGSSAWDAHIWTDYCSLI